MIPGLLLGGGLAAQAVNQIISDRRNQADMRALRSAAAKISDPRFDVSSLTPVEAQAVAAYSPEAARFIAESAPTTLQSTRFMDLSRQAQWDALSRLQAMASGRDESLEAAQREAYRQSQRLMGQAAQARDQQMRRRGLGLGSGAAWLLDQQAAAQAQDSLVAQQDRAIQDSVARRGQWITQSAGLARDLNASEVDFQSRNADIINLFNQRQADRAQQAELFNVSARNRALEESVQRQQQVALENARQRNEQARWEREQHNRLMQQQFDNQMSRLEAQQRLTGLDTQRRAARTQGTANLITGTVAGLSKLFGR